MGRNAYPIALLAFSDKKHLSKDEVLNRLENEISIGDQNFEITPLVSREEYAKKKWDELIKRYVDSGFEFVSTSDTGILERYCVTYGEYLWMQDVRDLIRKKSSNKTDKNGNKIDPLIVEFRMIDEYKLMEKINKKLELLLQMEQQLFLTPLSKVKNIVKRNKEKGKTDDDILNEMGFGNL